MKAMSKATEMSFGKDPDPSVPLIHSSPKTCGTVVEMKVRPAFETRYAEMASVRASKSTFCCSEDGEQHLCQCIQFEYEAIMKAEMPSCTSKSLKYWNGDLADNDDETRRLCTV